MSIKGPRFETLCTAWMIVNDSENTEHLLDRIEAGDESALDQLLDRHRDLLRRFIDMRLSPRLRARVDASDVVQEAQIELAKRIQEFLQRRPMPFHVWLRKTAYQNLLQLRRAHQAQCRDLNKDVAMPHNSSVMLVQHLFQNATGPLQNLLAQEMSDRVHEAVLQLSETNQEILLLRTVEGLSNEEVAQVLDLEKGTASKRYTRALLQLRDVLRADGILESQS